MRKDELIASVQKLILKQGVTQDALKAVHPKVVEGEIAKAYNSMLKTFYMNDANLNNADLDYYAKKYTATVQKDSDGFFYASLPAYVLELKDGLGIRSVTPKGGTYQFVRTKENSLARIRKLPVYCCLKDAYYYKDGSRVVLDFPVVEYSLVEEVYLKVLPLFSEFEDSDNIEFPQGEIPAMQMILQLMGFRPTDNINDGVR